MDPTSNAWPIHGLARRRLIDSVPSNLSAAVSVLRKRTLATKNSAFLDIANNFSTDH